MFVLFFWITHQKNTYANRLKLNQEFKKDKYSTLRTLPICMFPNKMEILGSFCRLENFPDMKWLDEQQFLFEEKDLYWYFEQFIENKEFANIEELKTHFIEFFNEKLKSGMKNSSLFFASAPNVLEIQKDDSNPENFVVEFLEYVKELERKVDNYCFYDVEEKTEVEFTLRQVLLILANYQKQSLENAISNSNNSIRKDIDSLKTVVEDGFSKIEKTIAKDSRKKIDGEKILSLKKDLSKPILIDHYYYLLANCYRGDKKKNRILRRSQLRILYTILFFTVARLNELRLLKLEDVENIILTGEISIYHSKTNTKKIHFIGEEGQKALSNLKNEIENLRRNKIEVLNFSTKGTILTTKRFIKFVNEDLNEVFGDKKFTSHSFRSGFITRLLKVANIHQVQEIVGHSSITSTIRYNRYVIKKEDLQSIFTKSLSFVGK